MGVVGVLICFDGGGLRLRSAASKLEFCSCNAAIFAAVGVLNGATVMGGIRSGWRFFLPCIPADLSPSMPDWGWNELFRVLPFL